VFINVDINKLAEKCLNGLIVNNLVFKEGGLNADTRNNSKNNDKIFDGLKPEKLFVLTFLDVVLQTETSVMNWKVFEYFKELKAIHIENGTLNSLDNDFYLIPHQNILTITFNNNKLEKIEKSVFNDWNQLKMMTINDNLIEDLDWITSELPALWYLDLRYNKLTNIPKGLEDKLPSLRVLKLGDNVIRTFPDLTLESLGRHSLLKINEFSFDKTRGNYINQIFLIHKIILNENFQHIDKLLVKNIIFSLYVCEKLFIFRQKKFFEVTLFLIKILICR
jgi:Leucine-rich repeat (LRR) protein